jgi:hypothetical protein
LLWLRGFWLFLPSDADVLHVATPKDDVLVDTAGRGNLIGGIPPPAFCAIGHDILKGYRGGLRVDFMEGADISNRQ